MYILGLVAKELYHQLDEKIRQYSKKSTELEVYYLAKSEGLDYADVDLFCTQICVRKFQACNWNPKYFPFQKVDND